MPEVSVAVQVTIVSPRGNDSGASLEIDEIPIISSAIESSKITLFSCSDTASIITDSGTSILGDVVSTTVTSWVSDAELPEVSVAVQVTIVSPRGNDSGASLDIESISEISSIINSPKSSIVVLIPVASISISLGIDKIGFIVSITITLCVWVDWLPDWSVTIQVTIVSPNGNIFGASFVIVTSCISLISGISNSMSVPLDIVASKMTGLRRK